MKPPPMPRNTVSIPAMKPKVSGATGEMNRPELSNRQRIGRRCTQRMLRAGPAGGAAPSMPSSEAALAPI